MIRCARSRAPIDVSAFGDHMRSRGEGDDLGMNAPITRRDFLSGVLASGATAATRAFAQNVDYYPPAWTGLRGSHVGSFEAAHALAREHKQFSTDAPVVDGEYDLVVVGAGISGLAAAYFFRQRNPRARILLLDSHDDFGGHAKRNEFAAPGLIGYGGSQSIDGPAHYSAVAKAVLVDLGIDTQRFYTAYDRNFYEGLGLSQGVHFAAGPFTRNAVVKMDLDDAPSAATLAQVPMTDAGRADLARLYSPTDFLPGQSTEQRLAFLRRTSYLEFIRTTVGAGSETAALMKKLPSDLWGLHYDALSALEGYRLGQPGFTGLPFDAVDDPYPDDEPYIFHFPDGNAAVARSLVRRLIPAVAPGHSMDDIVEARFDYARLDEASAPVRVRLNSTALNVKPSDAGVAVTYARGGTLERVRSRQCVLACYHAMIPYLLPELPAEQRAALAEAVRTPLVYTNVVLRNWQPFVAAGIHRFYAPTGYYTTGMLDFPVSLGGYTFPHSPNEPIVVHLTRLPAPGNGARDIDQFRAGRYELLGATFEQMELDTRRQLADTLGSYGFDPARDVVAITINRWPHGYAREYNELFDPNPKVVTPSWVRARAPYGAISIACSDAEGHAYVDGAIDAAHRAVDELG
jgi:spermidine dehydrogenase